MSRCNRINDLRRKLWPKIHDAKQDLHSGLFGKYTLRPEERVGTVHKTPCEFQSDLRDMGFSREPVAALKYHEDGRKSAGSWAWRESRRANKQLHVTIFDNGDGTTEINAHWEYSWITHPVAHYRGVDYDRAAGVQMMEERLFDHGVPFVMD